MYYPSQQGLVGTTPHIKHVNISSVKNNANINTKWNKSRFKITLNQFRSEFFGFFN